jgi:hypothetical protein
MKPNFLVAGSVIQQYYSVWFNLLYNGTSINWTHCTAERASAGHTVQRNEHQLDTMYSGTSISWTHCTAERASAGHTVQRNEHQLDTMYTVRAITHMPCNNVFSGSGYACCNNVSSYLVDPICRVASTFSGCASWRQVLACFSLCSSTVVTTND